jgi:EpsI family protein
MLPELTRPDMAQSADRNEPLSKRWIDQWLVLGLVALAALTMSPALLSLGSFWWRIQGYQHGILIAALCLLWLWLWRERPLRSGVHPSWWLLPVWALLWALWYALWQGNSEIGTQALIPAVLWTTLAVPLGVRAAATVALPIGFFYFAIPLWDELLPVLQKITVFGGHWGMTLAGVPVAVSGNKIVVPEGTFEIIYDCSGLRFLVVSLALATLVAVVEGLRRWRFVSFLVLTAMLAIVANWMRVCIVIYAGHVTGMAHYFVSESHLGLGNAVFAVLLVAVYWLAHRMGRHAVKAPHASASTPPAAVDMRTAIVMAVLLVAAVGITAKAEWSSAPPDRLQLAPAPVSGGGWQGPLPAMAAWSPSFPDAADTLRASYRQGDQSIEVYVNVYGRQQQGKELVYFRNLLLAPGKWRPTGAAAGPVAAMFASSPTAVEVLDGDGQRWLMAHIYVIGGRLTAWGPAAQVSYGIGTVLEPRPAGVVAIAIRCQADCSAARPSLQRFWAQLGNALVATIPTRMRPA